MTRPARPSLRSRPRELDCDRSPHVTVATIRTWCRRGVVAATKQAGRWVIDTDSLAHPRRPVCKACLDWSERRHHLAGTLGAAVMARFTELKWAARDDAPGSRVVNFSRTGEKRFAALFGGGEA